MLEKNHKWCSATSVLITVCMLAPILGAQDRSHDFHSGEWHIAGQNLSNTWSQPAEHSISPSNVNGLKPKWVFTTGGDVSATPTVDGDAVYFRSESEQHMEPASRTFNQSQQRQRPKTKMGIHDRWRCFCHSYR